MHGLVSQDVWYKTCRLIAELVVMEREVRYGMSRARMDFIRGFMLYIYRICRDMTPYFKGVNLTMDSWRPYRDEEV